MVTKKTSGIKNKTKRSTKSGSGSNGSYSHSNIICTFLEMLNMVMRSRAAKKRAHVVELNEPVLKEENEEYSDQAK